MDPRHPESEVPPRLPRRAGLECVDALPSPQLEREPTIRDVYDLLLRQHEELLRVKAIVMRVAGAHVSHYPQDAVILEDRADATG